MLWTVMRLHVIFAALVFCGCANGFNVWNGTSIIDWQAGRSNFTWSQSFQLVTPGQPLGLPSRKGANGNDDGRQHGSSFVQSSGGAAQGKQVLNVHDQAASIQQQGNYIVPSSRIYWNEPPKPGNCGPLSQYWPSKAQYKPDFQNPSSSQPVGTTNQESWAKSPYQPTTTMQVPADPISSTSLVQSSGALIWYHNLTSQSIPSSSQSVITTNQVVASQSDIPSLTQGRNMTTSSGNTKWYNVLYGQMPLSSSKVLGLQTQLHQPTPTTPFGPDQSASTSQGQSSSASGLYQGQAISWSNTLQNQSVPFSSQSVVTATLPQSAYHHGIPTQVLAVNSSQSMDASTLYQVITSGRYTVLKGQLTPSSLQVSGLLGQPPSPLQSLGASLFQDQTSGTSSISQDQSIPSSFPQSLVATNQISASGTRLSFQPSTSPVLAEQTIASAQSMGISHLCSGQPSSWYTILQGKMIPSSQVSGLQTQSLEQPSSTTQVPASQSGATSRAQSLGDSPLHQSLTSSMNLSSLYQSTAFQSVAGLKQISGIQNQTMYWPNATQLSLSQSQSSGASQGQGIPSSSQSVITTNQGEASQSDTPSQTQGNNVTTSSGNAKWYNILNGQMLPSSSKVLGFQTQLHQPTPTTPFGPDQSASTSRGQSSSASALYQGQAVSWYNTSQDQSVSSSSQSVITATLPQSAYHHGIPTQVLAGNSSQSMDASTLYQVLTSGRYTVLKGQLTPSSLQVSGLQAQPSYQPSTATQVLQGQPPTSPLQSLGASLFQGKTSGTSIISQGQSLSSPSQSVVAASQSDTPSQTQGSNVTTSLGNAKWYNVLNGQMLPSSSKVLGFQTQLHLPSPTTSSASTPYQAISRYMISKDQSIPSSSQSVVTANQPQLPAYQPGTLMQVLAGQSASPSQPMDASTLYQVLTSGRYQTSLGQNIPSSSKSVVTTSQNNVPNTQLSYQPGGTTPVFAGQSTPTQSLGASPPCLVQTPSWYTILQGKLTPSSQVSFNEPSSTSQSPATSQSMRGSALPQGLTSNRNLSVPSTNQISYPIKTPGWYTFFQDRFPYSSQVSEFPSSSKPSTPTEVSSGQSASIAPLLSLGPTFVGQSSTSQQTQTSMLLSGLASVATGKTSPKIDSTSQGRDSYAVVLPQVDPQKLVGILSQGSFPDSEDIREWPAIW